MVNMGNLSRMQNKTLGMCLYPSLAQNINKPNQTFSLSHLLLFELHYIFNRVSIFKVGDDFVSKAEGTKGPVKTLSGNMTLSDKTHFFTT